MLNIVLFILLLSVLVLVHEFGHFWVAKKRGMKVEEFGLGYPPTIKKLFTWQGTDFTLNAIPFGGFVRLLGENYDPEDDKLGVKKNRGYDSKYFYNFRILDRLAVVLAGPMANIVYGVVVFSIIFSVLGIPTDLQSRARIAEIAPNSPAAEAGMQKDMEIIAFRLKGETIPTKTFREVIDFVDLNRGETVSVVYQGPCQEDACPEIAHESEIYLRKDEEIPAGQGAMGVAFAEFYFKKGPWYLQIPGGIWYGLQQAFGLGVVILVSLFELIKNLIGGVVPTDVAGPIGIVDQANQTGILTQGWESWLSFSGMLSVNLAIMNLLPIPALDGGRAVFIALEKVIGKKRVQNIESYANYGGFILLIGLMILISIRDVRRIIQ